MSDLIEKWIASDVLMEEKNVSHKMIKKNLHNSKITCDLYKWILQTSIQFSIPNNN